MRHIKVSVAEQKSRQKYFAGALDTLRKFGLTVPQIGKLIGLPRRTIFRINAGLRPIGHQELLAIQTAALTCLAVQNVALETPRYDIRMVLP